MGTTMSVDIRAADMSPDAVSAAVERAFLVLRDDDRRFSTYREDSEVRQLSRGAISWSNASSELRQVLAIGEAFEESSQGAFRCHTPAGELDLNGVVKGWSVTRATEALVTAGLHTFCFNAGGDVVVSGEPDPGRPWHVAVRSPRSPDSTLAVLAVRDQAVATSGAYERGGHIWDGRTGQPAQGLLSATVVAADLTTADVLATAVFALGVDGVAWAAEHYSCSVLAVSTAGELLSSGDLRSLLAAGSVRSSSAPE